MEWLLLDSGDTKSQTDHSELMVFVFCLLSLNTCMTLLTICMFYKERTYRGRERGKTRCLLWKSLILGE